MKSKLVAYVLWLVSLFGWLGFHRFYLNKPLSAVAFICTGGLFGIGAMIDFFTLPQQVEHYNTSRELDTIRTHAVASTKKG